MLWKKISTLTSSQSPPQPKSAEPELEVPWVYEAKHPDHYVVLGRKEDQVEHYTYGMPGHSRYCWMPIPDDMHKVLVVLDREKYRKLPDNQEFSYWQYFEFQEPPLILTKYPGPWCIPQELLTYKPADNVMFKYFFKGTKNEMKLRQIFCHTELTEEESRWFHELQDYCRWKKFPWRGMAEPYVMRIAYYSWRRKPKDYLPIAYHHLLRTYSWRAQMFPISDQEPQLVEDLEKGIMYWVARDKELHPLLVVRISREHSKMPKIRFLRLTIFCFEWAVRYLFVPGRVETCTVLLDIQHVGLGDIPVATLGEMVTALTHEYPFRLDRMWVVHDSLFVSASWTVVIGFLSEIQREKIKVYRKKELLTVVPPFFAKHQLEEIYGGARPKVEKFFPFPLLPGPFDPDADGPDPNAVPDCHEAFTAEGSVGAFWVNKCRDQYQYSDKAEEVFKRCNLPFPRAKPEERAIDKLEKNGESRFPKNRKTRFPETGSSPQTQSPSHSSTATTAPSDGLYGDMGGSTADAPESYKMHVVGEDDEEKVGDVGQPSPIRKYYKVETPIPSDMGQPSPIRKPHKVETPLPWVEEDTVDVGDVGQPSPMLKLHKVESLVPCVEEEEIDVNDVAQPSSMRKPYNSETPLPRDDEGAAEVETDPSGQSLEVQFQPYLDGAKGKDQQQSATTTDAAAADNGAMKLLVSEPPLLSEQPASCCGQTSGTESTSDASTKSSPKSPRPPEIKPIPEKSSSRAFRICCPNKKTLDRKLR